MNTTYTPVDPDVMEFLEAEKENDSTRVFYFGEGSEIKEIRIDRIISYNLRPGPAYDEYDEYGLQCLTCQAGYDDLDD